MTITTLLDPAQMPNQNMDQQTFDNLWAGVLRALPRFGTEVNETAANLNAIAAGGAYATLFSFNSTATASVDPGTGKLSLNSATQVGASTIAVSNTLAGGATVSALLASMNGSTSSKLGHIRLQKVNDPSKWIVFEVRGATVNQGTYTTIPVTYVDSNPASSPFAAGDALMMFFQRTGDKGDQGVIGFSNMVVLRTTQSWTAPSWATRAEISVIDGGWGGSRVSSGTPNPGFGGKSSISTRAITPNATYTCTVGAGGAGSSTSGANGAAGGASSFSGPGLTTITSTTGADIVMSNGALGDSLYARTQGGNGGIDASDPGQGGIGGLNVNGGKGGAGAVIIRF